MGLTYYGYPKCGTCRKAKKWLETNGLDFQEVNIAENPPTEKELARNDCCIRVGNQEIL